MSAARRNGVTAALLAPRGFTADPAASTARGVPRRSRGRGQPGKGLARLRPRFDDRRARRGDQALSLRRPDPPDHRPDAPPRHRARRKPGAIETVNVYAGTNIFNPIRYPIAANHLQAKFSLPAAMAMIVVAPKREARILGRVRRFRVDAGHAAAREDYIRPPIEAMGFDKVRSRIAIRLKGSSRSRAGPTSATAAGRTIR